MSKNDSSDPKKTLFLDIGNSSIKVAYKENGIWTKTKDSFKSVTYLISWLNSHKESIRGLVVASVRKDHFKLLQAQVTDLTIQSIAINDVKTEMLDYDTPKTLGIDRFLVCLGAHQRNKKNVVVVDAGSACTIDMMDEESIYRGGIIMPGLQSILNVFKLTAPELPEIEIGFPKRWPGKSTSESLQWGQVAFFVDGIESALERFKKVNGNYDLYLTGGDASKLSKLISENSIQDEYLIFRGMEAFMNG
jgi:type III pantothenate kinase